MGLNYAEMLGSINSRLTGDTTVIANLDTRNDGSPAVFTEIAPSVRGGSTPPSSYIVLRLVSGTPSDHFEANGTEYLVDCNLWRMDYGTTVQSLDPYATGENMALVLDALRTRLDGWAPSITGGTCTAMQHDQLVTQHEAEAWHWIQTFRVWAFED